MPSRRRNAPSVPACLHRSASASNRRFSLPENWRRLAIATTSGSRRAASGETVSPVALRAPSATASPEDPVNSFKEDFSDEVMFMSYLYSKLPETGVPHRIGTGGTEEGETVRGNTALIAARQCLNLLKQCLLIAAEGNSDHVSILMNQRIVPPSKT